MKGLPVVLLLLTAMPAAALGQTAADDPRGVAFADIGYARTWDDEGFLGSGASLLAGVGYGVAPRLALQAIVERIPYSRDVEWLTFDGRIVFVGLEAVFHSSRRTIRPFVTVGAGVMNDDGIWVRKQQAGPGQAREEDRIDRRYTLAAMTASGGVDVRLSARLSLRASLRFHGLLDTGQDLAPHTSIQPSIGAAFRW